MFLLWQRLEFNQFNRYLKYRNRIGSLWPNLTYSKGKINTHLQKHPSLWYVQLVSLTTKMDERAKGRGKKQPTSLLSTVPYSMGGTCIYEMPLNKMFQSMITLKWSCDEMQRNLLFDRSKGHGSGCTIALSGMHHYIYCVYCLTPPTSLCSDNTQYLHRSTVDRIPKQCPNPRSKVYVQATHHTLWSRPIGQAAQPLPWTWPYSWQLWIRSPC